MLLTDKNAKMSRVLVKSVEVATVGCSAARRSGSSQFRADLSFRVLASSTTSPNNCLFLPANSAMALFLSKLIIDCYRCFHSQQGIVLLSLFLGSGLFS